MVRRFLTRKYPDWSEDGQTFVCDGKGYSLTSALKTKCVGDAPISNGTEKGIKTPDGAVRGSGKG